jgi:DNA sulfur modification protein DndE
MRIRISKQNDEVIDRIKSIYKFNSEGVVPRMAFAYSLQTSKLFDIDSAKVPSSDGKDFRDDRGLFGTIVEGKTNFPIFKAILDNHYKSSLSETDFTKLFKLHLEHGLNLISNELDNKDFTSGYHIDFLMKLVKNGLSLRSNQVYVNINATTSTNGDLDVKIGTFSEPVIFKLGNYSDGTEIIIRINDEKEWSSRNLAIAGQNGSGKSQLILDILYQISKNTNCKLPFTFFDFKGTDTKESLNAFLDNTDCTFLKVEHNKGFPFSPLKNIDFSNPNNILAFANDFQTFFPEIKQVQSASLIRSIQEFINDNERAPSLTELMEAILERNNERDNTTTSVLQQIISSGIYDEDASYNLFNRSTYVSMPSDVSKQIKQFVTFNQLKYLFNKFKLSGNTNVNNNIKELKHIIVIDEAQNFLQKKSARPVIEDMLRELRSIGIIIVLIAQETTDFAYPDFDFISQVRLPICADVNDKSTNRMVKFIGSVNSELSLNNEIKDYTKVEEDEKGFPIKKAIININNPKSMIMRQFWKSIKNV